MELINKCSMLLNDNSINISDELYNEIKNIIKSIIEINDLFKSIETIYNETIKNVEPEAVSTITEQYMVMKNRLAIQKTELLIDLNNKYILVCGKQGDEQTKRKSEDLDSNSSKKLKS